MRSLEKLDRLPLRQHVRSAGAGEPGLADRDLLESLSRPDRFRIVSLGERAEILAANELALAEARLAVQQACKESLLFENVFPHTYLDPARGTPMEPVMFLRVDAPKAHARALVQRLKERGAVPQQAAGQRKRVVLRAEAPLAGLLGFGKEALELTDGSAQVLSWLLRYQAAHNPSPEILNS